jgi:hypothetical protein
MFRRKNVAKGLAAGAIGGLVGTIVMTQFQNAWQKSSRSLKREEESQPEVMSSSAQAEETWGIQTGTEGASRSTAKVYSVRQTGAEKEGADKKEQSGNKENKEDDNATTKVAEAVAKVGGRHLAPGQKKTGGTIVHYVFGTLMGAAYGVAVELGSRRIRRNQLLSGLGCAAGFTPHTATFRGSHRKPLVRICFAFGIRNDRRGSLQRHSQVPIICQHLDAPPIQESLY